MENKELKILEKIKLFVNDKEIPLNEIMSSVLTNIIVGFIEVLKGIPEKKKYIKVEIIGG